jgi:uncharacterized protein (TIGR02265 family)
VIRQPRPSVTQAPDAKGEPSQTRIAVASQQGVRSKGTTLAAVLGYTRDRHGEEGVARLAQHLRSPAAARHLQELLLRGSWYPFADFIALLEAGDAAFPDRTSFAARQGAYGAETDLRGVYRAFIRLATPRFLIERAGAMWSQYYNSGTLRVTEPGAGQVHFELTGFGAPHRLHCDAVLGWCARAAELTGAKGVQGQQISCRGDGESRCRFRLDWR